MMRVRFKTARAFDHSLVTPGEERDIPDGLGELWVKLGFVESLEPVVVPPPPVEKAVVQRKDRKAVVI